jgi:PAS domain S-box-containing protein
MATVSTETPVRVLVVDDNASIHEDFRRVLGTTPILAGLAEIDAELGRTQPAPLRRFSLVTCADGAIARERARAARESGEPFAVAFVDLRMPSGPDGVATAEALLADDPEIQLVLCTAYADHSWEAIARRIGEVDRLLILKKPFDPIEVQQLAAALGAKWALSRENRRQMEEIRSRQQLLQALLDYAPVAVVLAGADRKVRLVNRAFETAIGVSRDAALGQDLVSLLPPVLHAAARERMTGAIERGEVAENERELADPLAPNRPRRYLLTTFPVIDERGDRGMCAIGTDITRHRALEDQLRQAQRMEAIGRLAGGIAHDFNNLLTAILGYAELLRMHLPENDRLAGYAHEVYRSGQRAAGMTKQLLAFSRRQVLAPQVVDLNHVVREMERLLARLIGEDIAMEIRLDSDLGTVRVDPSQLEQVVMNLVVHARDALHLSGTQRGQAARVVLATADVRIDADTLQPHQHQGTALAPGVYACLSVSDNGTGMDAATREHIFEPFFASASRPERGGTKTSGMGLSTVYGIVQQSGGFIEVDSSPGTGSTFRVHLPHAGEPATPRAVSGGWARSPGGSETILLVEDQDDVRALLEKVLCDAGYTVLAAENPDVALGLAKQFGGRIHVMITDIVMPRIDGNELRNQVLTINPGLKVIFMSGYVDRELVTRITGNGRHPFLQKPFKGDELLRTVRSVLEG